MQSGAARTGSKPSDYDALQAFVVRSAGMGFPDVRWKNRTTGGRGIGSWAIGQLQQ
jgi:hypothetical protein